MWLVSYTVFFCQHYALTPEILQRPIVVCDGEGISVIKMDEKVAREGLYSGSGYISVYRLWKSVCDLEKALIRH